MNAGNQDLAHVYWLGGSPCAGKSTVADQLARRYHLSVFHIDDYGAERRQRITPEKQPTMSRLLSLDCDELWMRDIAKQVRTAIAFYEEEFALVLGEIRDLPADRALLVEGASLLPAVVAPLLTNARHALWMVPTESAQRAWYARRPWIHEVLRDCTDKQRAFDRWMARDAEVAKWVQGEACRHDQRLLIVDGRHDLEQTTARVARLLGLG